MNTRQDIEQALQLLKDNGYYVENLWCVEDVQSIFNCDSDTAQSVLNEALTNEHLMEEIWFQIRHHGEAMGIPY
jgi:hypothetical protein